MARSSPKIRWFYVAYFGATALFSLAFKTLGGVGAGAGNRIRSATVAQQVTPGVFDCSQWNCLAAVNGGQFSITHNGSGRAYAASEEFETAVGVISTGHEAKFEVDIPVASTRTAIARFRATANPVSVRVDESEFADGKLASCRVALEGLPSEPIEAYVCHRDVLFRMRPERDTWVTDRRRSTPTSVFISSLDQPQGWGGLGWGGCPSRRSSMK